MAEGYTEELFLLYNSQICRLCGEENSNGYPLFRNDPNETDLSVLINTYLPLKITDDGNYPRWICPGCHLQVHSTVQFFTLVVSGQESLRQIYKSQCEEQERAAAELSTSCSTNSTTTENQAILGDGADLNGKTLAFGDNILQQMGINPTEAPKRKRGRPPKTAPQFLETKQKPTEETPILKETQIVEEPIVEGTHGRRKRKIKVPSRFQEAVQGKELEKVYMESGVIERSNLGSDIDDDFEALRGDFDIFYPEEEEVIGHLQDNEGVNLGDLVLINKKKKCYKRKTTRFMCDICKICFCYEQKFLQHRFSHQNVRFECTQCLQSFVERIALVQHQIDTDHKGEGIIEGFTILPFDSSLNKTTNDEALDVNSPEQSHLENNFAKEVTSKTDNLVGSQIVNIDDYDSQFEDVFKKIDEAEAEKVLQDIKSSTQSNFINLPNFSVEDNNKTIENDKRVENVENLSDEFNGSQIEEADDDVADEDSAKKKSYHCHLCDRYFKHMTTYFYHKESEHNDGRRFACSKCKKSFKNKTLFRRHQLVHSSLRPYACDSCNATFKTKTNLYCHKISHTGEKKYQCNICEKFFAHKNSLTLHLRCHTGQKPFKCSVCSKTFSQFGNMQEHLRIHTGECPFECQICGRKFKTSSQCRMHVKRHDAEKPLKCTICEKSFIQLQEYKNHQRRHNNIKPYSCDVCAKRFIELGALRKHLRLHTGERPYVCTECPRRFADRSNLKKHLKIHENKKRSNESLMDSTKLKTTAQTLDELTASVVDSQSLILSESGSNPVGDSTMWSLVDNDSCLDSSAVASMPQSSIVSNQLVYVTYQDPDNPIGNKTTLFVVNDTNTGSMVDDLKINSMVSNLDSTANLDENCSDDQLLQHSNVFLTNNDNNSNDIQTVLLNIQDQVGIQLDQNELFQSDDVSNSAVQLVTGNGQKMRLLNYADSLDIPD